MTQTDQEIVRDFADRSRIGHIAGYQYYQTVCRRYERLKGRRYDRLIKWWAALPESDKITWRNIIQHSYDFIPHSEIAESVFAFSGVMTMEERGLLEWDVIRHHVWLTFFNSRRWEKNEPNRPHRIGLLRQW